MKVFHINNINNGGPPFDEERWNFIDQHNVFVGWCTKDSETRGGCDCSYQWQLIDSSEQIIAKADSNNPHESNAKEFTEKANAILEPYSFDTRSWKLSKNKENGYIEGVVVFTLIAKEKPNLYLKLQSNHNGYYAQGFEFMSQGQRILSQYL